MIIRGNMFFYRDVLHGKVQHRDCTMVKDYIFVKTHKAGSTTLISVLQRFGFRHDLQFALPIRGK